MLLNDIGTSPNSTFRKINHHLETNYGFKISEDVSDKDLVAIMEQLQDEVIDLKIKGDNSGSSPEITKRLLVLEGLRNLREIVMEKFQSRKLDNVVNNLSDFIIDTFDLTATEDDAHDCFERAVHKAMEEYRSSRYRFPDDMIDHRIRNEAMARINDEDREINHRDAFADSEDYVAEGDPERSEFTANNKLAAQQGTPSTPSTPMVRNKAGQMVPDPFAAQAAARRTGRVAP